MNRSTIKTFILALLIAVTIPLHSGASAATQPTATSFDIRVPSAILVDESTGDVLWEKNADERRAMASTTKMMTAILALEREEMEDTVTIGEEVKAAGQYGIKLAEGEQLVFRDLLYALLLSSANDVALAVADHIGGSVDKFVNLMNSKAIRIGAPNTHYANPHGLSDKMNYSTARDLAAIARYGLKNDDFKTIVSTREWRLQRADPEKPALMENRNKLLEVYPLATGVKTGYINEAGYCLVSSAETDTVALVAVVLGAKSYKSVFNESRKLLDYGFSMYEKKTVIRRGHAYCKVMLKYDDKLDLVARDDVDVYIRRSLDTSTSVSINGDIDYPVEKGKVMGKVSVYQAGREIASADLIAGRKIDKPGLGKVIRYQIYRFKGALARLFTK